MAELNLEIVRHALEVARKNGFSEIELSVGDAAFSARLEPLSAKAKSKKPSSAEPSEAALVDLKATLVGYLRSTAPIGERIAPGTAAAVVEALGLANDVETPVGGEVVEVLVEVGQPVQFGQVLLRLRP